MLTPDPQVHGTLEDHYTGFFARGGIEPKFRSQVRDLAVRRLDDESSRAFLRNADANSAGNQPGTHWTKQLEFGGALHDHETRVSQRHFGRARIDSKYGYGLRRGYHRRGHVVVLVLVAREAINSARMIAEATTPRPSMRFSMSIGLTYDARNVEFLARSRRRSDADGGDADGGDNAWAPPAGPMLAEPLLAWPTPASPAREFRSKPTMPPATLGWPATLGVVG